MINNLPKNREKLFSDSNDMRCSFFTRRRRIARKLGDQSILNIHFHTFRHWKATQEYHNTKDLIHVQQVLGHKNIEITRGYIVIEQALYGTHEDDGFTTKVATTQKEIIELLDSGFDYVMQKDGLAYFRKRK
jgi:integrase